MLFDSWFVDLSDFAFFFTSYIESAPKMNIKTYDFEYLGSSTSESKFNKNYGTTGYFDVEISQSEL